MLFVCSVDSISILLYLCKSRCFCFVCRIGTLSFLTTLLSQVVTQAIYDRFKGQLLESLKKVNIFLAEKSLLTCSCCFFLIVEQVGLASYSFTFQLKALRGKGQERSRVPNSSCGSLSLVLSSLLFFWFSFKKGRGGNTPVPRIKRRRLKRNKPFLIREQKITRKI